jgi:hypothetical protein
MISLRLQRPLIFGPRPDRKYDPHYQRALAEATEAAKNDRPIRRVRASELSEELKLHLRLDVLEAQGLVVDRKLFGTIYARTRQQLLAPEVTNRLEAVCAAWSQPEAQALWERWAPPIDSRASDTGAYEAAKAVLTMTAAMGDIFVKHGRQRLLDSPRALKTFHRLARGGSRGDAVPDDALPVPSYTAVTKLVKRLVDEQTPELVQQACVEIVRTLGELFPEAEVGRWVSVDAQMVAAWVEQKSGKTNGEPDPEREAWLTRRCAEAGYRVYGYDLDGIGDPEERATVRDRKKVRGYLQVLDIETSTGLALVGSLTNAQTTYEPAALHPLLLRLYGLWPGIPLRGVIGDKLYDTFEACLTCELDFGLIPIFIRQPGHADKGGILFAPEEHDSIARINGWGVATCRKHKLPMRMESFEWPGRSGLKPGERGDARRLRYRLVCSAPDPCARPSLSLASDRVERKETIASALVPLPHHHLSGKPELFALRQALQAVRNSASESAFGSLLTGYGLGGRDSKRPRVYDREVLETLHWLALATRALLTLLTHRMHEDEVHEHLKLLAEPHRSPYGVIRADRASRLAAAGSRR